MILGHRRFQTPKQRQKVTLTALESPKLRAFLPGSLSSYTFIGEFQALVETSYFGQFKYNSNIEDIDFNTAFQTIERYAPQWYLFLRTLLLNQRAHRRSYPLLSNDTLLQRRMFLITSIICHSRTPTNSNFLSSLLAIYLLGSGTKRRVVETLSGLGVCQNS
ncbi:hypothetical protein BGZ60DRAFT_235534 [Tricladium varicosporioides]|nr:hypothetical protein BGZ60DRAFT_235534 [Hymenoscyphus varicosporioides]